MTSVSSCGLGFVCGDEKYNSGWLPKSSGTELENHSINVWVAAKSPGPQPFPLITLFSVLLSFNDQVIESWATKTNTADPCEEYHGISAVVTVHKAVVRLTKDCCLTIFTTTGIIIVTVTGIHR